jgi:hypothetical protein
MSVTLFHLVSMIDLDEKLTYRLGKLRVLRVLLRKWKDEGNKVSSLLECEIKHDPIS